MEGLVPSGRGWGREKIETLPPKKNPLFIYIYVFYLGHGLAIG